jgi:hypothetical protein
LRDQLIAEIHDLKDGDDLALWAHRRLSAKNTLSTEDARAVEIAYEHLLSRPKNPPEEALSPSTVSNQPLPDDLNRAVLDGSDFTLNALQANILTPQNESASPAANGRTPVDDQPTSNKPEVTLPLIKTVRK